MTRYCTVCGLLVMGRADMLLLWYVFLPVFLKAPKFKVLHLNLLHTIFLFVGSQEPPRKPPKSWFRAPISDLVPKQNLLAS